MNKLCEIDVTIFDIDAIETILKESTIFYKIEFSGITKEEIKSKIVYLETKHVSNREVLLNMPDNGVTEYWFKNWLHPKLKHAVKPAPKDKRGCSKKVISNYIRRDMLRFYENGQQNFNYTLDDIKQWLGE